MFKAHIILFTLAGLLTMVGCNDQGELSYGGEPVKANDNSDQYAPGGSFDDEGGSGGDGGIGGSGGGGEGGGSGESGGSGGNGDDGDFEPTYASGAFYLNVEGFCSIIWDAEGPTTSCSGCDYAFDLDLENNTGDCDGVGDSSGTMEFDSGSAYFEGNYVGTTSQSSNSISWATAGYVVGVGGYGYAYYGYLDLE